LLAGNGLALVKTIDFAAELTALIAIVLQLSIWVAFTANLIGPQ
jgi:hypothetical protein